MAYALVGTIGVASQGAAGASVIPAWGTGENRTPNNLLVCFVSVTGDAAPPTTPAGWSIGVQVAAANSCSAQIYWKIAAGGDAAPTITAAINAVIAAQLAEFSGNATTSPGDKFNGAISTSSPVSCTFGAPDIASGELYVIASGDFRSTNRAPNDILTSNNATITQAGNNNGVSGLNHYSFGYSLATTSNASSDTAVMTPSVTTSITGLAVAGCTFKLAPVILPDINQQPLVPADWR